MGKDGTMIIAELKPATLVKIFDLYEHKQTGTRTPA
jgi:hypothetical protein